MNKIRYTVYIPSHNKGEFLEEAVESVLRQSVDGWELLLINDNSSDNTDKIMNYYEGDDRIRLYTTDGIGLPAVSNLAIREAKGEYIIRLDGDDVFEENILLVLGSYLDNNPDVAMVFPDFFYINERGRILSVEYRKKILNENQMLDMPPNGACILCRTKILKNLNGYREDLGVQDGYDLWTKLQQQDYLCSNVNLPLFYYRRHDDNITNNVERIMSARRTIKKDVSNNDYKDFSPIIAVIPCRRNYDFCTDLWKKELNGVSLLEKNIQVCLSTKVFDYVIVASDNLEVKNILNQYQDPRLKFYKREQKNTLRSVSIVHTLYNIIREYDPQFKGITLLNYIPVPFLKKETMEESIDTLVINRADCSVGVEEIREPIYQRSVYGLQPINPPSQFSTDFEKLYKDTRTSMATLNSNLKKQNLTGPRVVYYEMSKNESFFIDSEQNLNIAQIMAERKSN